MIRDGHTTPSVMPDEPIRPGFVAFTICSRNFLAQAQVLHEGLRRHHPGIAFYVALCDDAAGIDFEALPFEVLPLSDLGIPQLRAMAEHYNITELNTSIKPFAFLTLFDRHPGAAVAYFDPDIWVTARLEELEALLAGGADCVLTPHMCEPAEFAEMHEGRILQYGIYNLGFCALRDTPEVRRVAGWWARRLETQCVIDLPKGLFVDQKWADLLPAFIGRTAILRHPGYNVAYWNLAQRTVRAAAGQWQVNGLPLRFFHFSGSVVDDPATFTRHSEQFRTEALRDVRDLFDAYCAEVQRFGRASYRRIPYAFSWSGSSGRNEHTPEAVAERARSEGRDARALSFDARPPHLPILRLRSLAEREAARTNMQGILRRRSALEAALIPPAGTEVFDIDGICAVCGGVQRLRTSFMYALGEMPDGRRIPNWREHLQCVGCGFVSRLRLSLHLLFQELSPKAEARIYVTEQVTPLHAWLKRRFPRLVGSEYLGPDRAAGEVVDGIRHEDVQRLSLADASQDVVLSFDVMEHVPDAGRAFREFARVLAPGGSLMFTAPFSEDHAEHVVRATLAPDGGIVHLMEPEYHGNPVDVEGGSLCFRYFGWRTMQDLAEAGFEEPQALSCWSRSFGYLGSTGSVIVARKRG